MKRIFKGLFLLGLVLMLSTSCIKRDNMEYKIDNIKDFEEMDEDEKLNNLKEIVKKSFYDNVKSKNMWNKVLNNYIKPTIKKLHPRYNSDVKLKIIN